MAGKKGISEIRGKDIGLQLAYGSLNKVSIPFDAFMFWHAT
jgi:hypothetical protein